MTWRRRARRSDEAGSDLFFVVFRIVLSRSLFRGVAFVDLHGQGCERNDQCENAGRDERRLSTRQCTAI